MIDQTVIKDGAGKCALRAGTAACGNPRGQRSCDLFGCQERLRARGADIRIRSAPDGCIDLIIQSGHGNAAPDDRAVAKSRIDISAARPFDITFIGRHFDIEACEDPLRPGIVHRLDKDTSGVMVVAKSARAFPVLKEEIATHEAQRIYVALVHGQMEGNAGVIRFPLGRSTKDRMKWDVQPKTGKPAVTHFRVLEFMPHYSWIECRLETGRTHQIRVHMAHIGHPVVNDPLYGWKKDAFPIEGQALHSRFLDLHHPVTGEAMHFEAPVPEDMLRCLEIAGKEEL